MRITIDEAAMLKDRFEDFVDGLIGQDAVVRRNPDAFTVEVMRRLKREAHIRPQLEDDIEVSCHA